MLEITYRDCKVRFDNLWGGIEFIPIQYGDFGETLFEVFMSVKSDL